MPLRTLALACAFGMALFGTSGCGQPPLPVAAESSLGPEAEITPSAAPPSEPALSPSPPTPSAVASLPSKKPAASPTPRKLSKQETCDVVGPLKGQHSSKRYAILYPTDGGSWGLGGWQEYIRVEVLALTEAFVQRLHEERAKTADPDLEAAIRVYADTLLPAANEYLPTGYIYGPAVKAADKANVALTQMCGWVQFAP